MRDPESPPRLSRRSFASAGLLWLAAAAVLPPGQSSAQPAERRDRAERALVAALREIAAGPSRFDPPSAAIAEIGLPITASQARTKLLAELSSVRLERLARDRGALRAFLELRRRADYDAGRTAWIEGWLLAETELCVMALGSGRGAAA